MQDELKRKESWKKKKRELWTKWKEEWTAGGRKPSERWRNVKEGDETRKWMSEILQPQVLFLSKFKFSPDFSQYVTSI